MPSLRCREVPLVERDEVIERESDRLGLVVEVVVRPPLGEHELLVLRRGPATACPPSAGWVLEKPRLTIAVALTPATVMPLPSNDGSVSTG